jgi:hypothetical protein
LKTVHAALINVGRCLYTPVGPSLATSENVEWVRRQYGISVQFQVDRGGIVGVIEVIDWVESEVKMV